MDPYNPIIAQTYVKRVPFWHMLASLAVSVLILLGTIWAVTVIIFSLER